MDGVGFGFCCLMWLLAIGSLELKIWSVQHFPVSSRGYQGIGVCVSEAGIRPSGLLLKPPETGAALWAAAPRARHLSKGLAKEEPVRTRTMRDCVGNWVSGDALSLSGSSLSHKPTALSRQGEFWRQVVISVIHGNRTKKKMHTDSRIKSHTQTDKSWKSYSFPNISPG